jgi:hypothetical protein
VANRAATVPVTGSEPVVGSMAKRWGLAMSASGGMAPALASRTAS